MFGGIQFCVLLLSVQTIKICVSTYPQRSIYNKIMKEEEFEDFSSLIFHNMEARKKVLDEELTLFVPTNNAIQLFKKSLYSDMAFYHMAIGARTLRNLKSIQNVSSIKTSFPKLWITRTDDGLLFVNNAEIITYKSDYFGRTKDTVDGKDQVLHIIDDVLDPIIRNPKFPHKAYDFMAATERWHLDSSKSVAVFFHKVKEHKVNHLYELEGSNTYFIPVDQGIDPHKFKMLNKEAIFGHMVPGYVLFTKPTMKSVNYETMANDEDIYIVLSLEEIDSKIFVKGNTIIGTKANPKGEVLAEIVEANIPVFNGVVHLISQPIGVFERRLKPFPYLPIMEKLATDPTLSTIYDMGENTGFNKIFTTHNVKFTYFVPNDFAWKQIERKGLSFAGSNVDLLKRHLIVSDFPYTMEHLLALSSGKNFTHVELQTVGGFLRLMVLQIEGNFYIKWNKTYIKVLRPNYECTNGYLHVLAGPIANLS